jgi:hypothetical protein
MENEIIDLYFNTGFSVSDCTIGNLFGDSEECFTEWSTTSEEATVLSYDYVENV